MAPLVFRPDIKLQYKFFVITGVVAALVLAASIAFAVPVGLDAGGTTWAWIGLGIAVGANALWIVPLLIAIPPYYHSLRYEIHEDEVIVFVGIITQSVKHVPYRTVTNLKVSRGPFDRLFGIGTLHIQTAGISGQRAAEESLLGLPNYQEVYEHVARSLRRFRRAMGPTQAAEEEEAVAPDGRVMGQVLNELQAIRRVLERQQGRGGGPA